MAAFHLTVGLNITYLTAPKQMTGLLRHGKHCLAYGVDHPLSASVDLAPAGPDRLIGRALGRGRRIG